MNQNSLEGILIQKTPYQDRHVVGKLLLRNGQVLTSLFYGGQGGGKKMKPSNLELGYLIDAQITKRSASDFSNCREWKVGWSHEKIRFDFKSYAVLCFMCEFVMQISSVLDEGDLEQMDHRDQGLFRLLANGVHYMDKELSEQRFSREKSLLTFLAKASIELGVFPELDRCVVSGEVLSADADICFLSDQGGFAYAEMASGEAYRGPEIRELRLWLKKIAYQKYQSITEISESPSPSLLKRFYFFVAYQLQLKESEFKSFSMVF